MRWIALLAALVAGPALAQAPAPGDLVLNEVMYDPPSPQPTGNEWLEVLNVTDGPHALDGVVVADAAGASDPIPAGVTVAAGGFVVLVRNGADFAAAYPGVAFVEVGRFPALNNSGDRPALVLGGTEIDAVPYAPSWGGSDASLERRDPLGPSTAASNFGTTTDPAGGTPGAPNTLFAPDTTGPVLVDATASEDGRTVTVSVDEPLDPASVSASAFSVSGGPAVTAASYDDDALTVTLTLSAPLAPGTSTVTASGLRDTRGNTTGSNSTTVDYDPDLTPPTLLSAEALDAQTVRATFDEPLDPASAETPGNYAIDPDAGTPTAAALQDDDVTVRLTLGTPLSGPASYTLTVQNVADVSGNAIATQTAAFFFGEGDAAAPRDLVVNEFLYDEPAADNPGEFVELFNRSGRTFDLRDFTLNDGTGPDEPITAEAVFVGPGGYAVVVEDGALFQAVFPDVAFVEQPAWSALNNTGDAIVLRYEGIVVDSLLYSPSWGGQDASLERKDPDGPSSVAANYATTADLRGGTPGELNSRFAPDVTGPTLVDALVRPDGRRILVTLDEPVDPASVTPSAFTIAGGPAVTSADYTPGGTTVLLGFAEGQALAVGTATLTATGLTDGVGNVTASTSIEVTRPADDSPPTITRAAPQSATVVRVQFSEPVTAATGAAAGTYTLASDAGTIAVAAVAVVRADAASGQTGAAGVLEVDLTLAAPLPDRTLTTLTATGLQDLAGNVAEPVTARLFFGDADTPAPGEIVITEIMYDPSTGSDGEYLELLNTTADRLFDLRAVRLGDADAPGDPLSDAAAVLLPGESLAVVRDADGFRTTFPEAAFVEGGSVIGLSNSGETLTLRAGDTVVESVAYAPDWHRVELDDATGISLERRDPAGPSGDAANWSSSLAEQGGTPSAPNSVSISGTPVERDAGLTVTSPFAPTRGEAAQITYTLSTEAALVRARVYDGGGRQVREIEAGRFSGSTATLVWDGTDADRRPVRAGIYVVLVEAVDAQGGTTEALRGVVVLARPE